MSDFPSQRPPRRHLFQNWKHNEVNDFNSEKDKRHGLYEERIDKQRDAKEEEESEWLDKNLPGMVEKMVQAEIARIAGKRS